MFWVTLWRTLCGKEIISSVNNSWGPEACRQPWDSAWTWIFWGLPTNPWVSSEADPPIVDPWDDGSQPDTLIAALRETLSHNHPTTLHLQLNSCPTELWDNRYCCFKLLNCELICYAAIDNLREYLLFSGSVLGRKNVTNEWHLLTLFRERRKWVSTQTVLTIQAVKCNNGDVLSVRHEHKGKALYPEEEGRWGKSFWRRPYLQGLLEETHSVKRRHE